ncbi:ribonuclease H-like domain-containing protein [Tanacetum coccineum]
MSGDDILNQFKGVDFLFENVEKRPWKKKSIFFTLPYRKNLLLRHNLDVMHIEKNVCDNFVGTLLGRVTRLEEQRDPRVTEEIKWLARVREAGRRDLAQGICFLVFTSWYLAYRKVSEAADQVNFVPSGLVSIKPALDPSTHEDPFVNSVSVVYLSCNPVQHQRNNHIKIDIHFVRDLVAARQVRVLHVPSRYQFADIFTKGLSSASFEEFRSSLSVRCPPAQTAGEC